MKTKTCILQRIQHSDDVKCREDEWRPSWLSSLFLQLEKEPSRNFIWHANVRVNHGFIGVSILPLETRWVFTSPGPVKQCCLLSAVLHFLGPSSFNILWLQHHKAKWNGFLVLFLETAKIQEVLFVFFKCHHLQRTFQTQPGVMSVQPGWAVRFRQQKRACSAEPIATIWRHQSPHHVCDIKMIQGNPERLQSK